jgi:hypothetical protein
MTDGYYENSSAVDQTLAEDWNGTSWAIVTSPDQSTTTDNQLEGVSCATASFCIAAGCYVNSGGYEQTLVVDFAMVCTGGNLAISSPASAAFPGVSLDGENQAATTSMELIPDDETGSGDGWNIDLTSTTLTNAGEETLPTTASNVTGVASLVADPSGSCSLPTNGETYPITVPAGATAPAAVDIYNAAAGTGEGANDVTLDFSITVPGYAYDGSYSSTWTYTIASGP